METHKQRVKRASFAKQSKDIEKKMIKAAAVSFKTPTFIKFLRGIVKRENRIK
jgi:hypothetical protein